MACTTSPVRVKPVSKLKVAISGRAVPLLALFAAFWATKKRMNQGMIAINDRVLKAP